MSFKGKIIRSIRRAINPPKWHNLKSVTPVSKIFGLDRGMAIDRYYIETFLSQNASSIKGKVLEISDSAYSKKFGHNITSFEVLHYDDKNPLATIVGDLTKKSTLPENKIDCFICTQTFQFIYNFKEAIEGSHYLLKEGGVLLATVAGISQISRYDMERWGDYWRFTSFSATKAFEEVFGKGNVKVDHFGNVLSTIAFLEGFSAEELSREELDYRDNDYQMLISIAARK